MYINTLNTKSEPNCLRGPHPTSARVYVFMSAL